MRRQRYLRTSSAHSLCIFCACRIAGDLPPSIYGASRKRLHDGRPRNQQAHAAAEQPSYDNGFAPQQPEHYGDSMLSASELAERARLRQAREDQERAQREANEARRRQREEARLASVRRQEEEAMRRREEQDRLHAQWRKEQDSAKAAEAEKRRLGREAQADQRRREGEQRESDSLFRAPRTEQVLGRKWVGPASISGRTQSSRKPQQQSARSVAPFAQDAPRARPDFGGAAQPTSPGPAVSDNGWGSGPVQRAPLVYGEQATPRQDPLWNEPTPNPNIQTTDTATPTFGTQRGSPFAEQPRQRPQYASRTRRNSQEQQEVQQQDPLELWEQQQWQPPPPPQQQQPPPTDHDFQGFGSGWDSPLNQQPEPAPEEQQRRRRGIDNDFLTTLQNGARKKTDVKREPRIRGADELRAVSQDRSPSARETEGYTWGVPKRASPGSGEGPLPTPSADEGWYDDAQPLSQNAPIEGPIPEHHPAERSMFHGQRPTQREFGSYQPPPPPQRPQNSYAMDGSNGYQATMLDADSYQPGPQEDLDESQVAEWQHLRRRKSAPASQRHAPPQQPQQAQEPQQDDADWIDRQFRAHVQEREQQRSPYPAYLTPQDQQSLFQTEQQQRQRQPCQQEDWTPFNPSRSPFKGLPTCARCLEKGHVARDCTGPVRAECRLCGEKGHMSFECPKNQRRGAGQGENRPRRMESPFAGMGAATSESVVRRTGGHQPEPFGASGQRDLRQREGRAQEAYNEPASAPREPKSPARHERAVDREDAVDDMRERMLKPSRRAEQWAQEEDEEPGERTLKSKKFADEPARREKGRVGRSRRDEEDNEYDDDAMAAREEARARKAARKEKKAEAEAARNAERKAEKARRLENGKPVTLPEFVSVATLAQSLKVRYEQLVTQLERLGYDDVFPTKILNAETSGMIAMEYGYDATFGEDTVAAEEEERDLKARPEPEAEDREFLPTRPPVVTIMGHVDHGKTTILDYLRKSSVAAGEAGGITQHIGAFSVPLASSGKTITFLDTPGHAAFLAMRQRGANVTDIVILVVAADDSVKPQTIEAIKHAKAAGVPMIVAVNKIDKEEADLQRVKQDLARHGVEIEDFGGETQVVAVSGKTGVGMEELEENVVTLSEILDHRAETEGAVEGWVLEATTKKAGRVATVLVRRGTLRQGSIIVAGNTWARVRSLRNEAGAMVKEVGPGMPVEVDGWRDQPAAGDEVLQAPSEQKANDVVEYRLEKEESKRTAEDMEAINAARRVEQEKREKERAAELAAKRKSNDDCFEAAAQALEEETAEEEESGGQMTVPFIIKADVSGSAEAVSAYIQSVSSPLIAPRILRSQVGPLSESDVELAAAAQGHIIAFNLAGDEQMKGAAESKGVKVLENNIIYRVLDDVKAVVEDKLPPIVTQRVLGEAEISAAFEIGVGGRKKVKIAGCKVRNGVVGRGTRVRVMRGSQKVYDGTVSSLKNVKKDVQEMRKGTECGMGFDEWEGFEVGDQVQTYEEIREKRKL